MKIVVSSSGEDIKSNVDSRFGRCTYFLAVEVEDGKIGNVTCEKNNGAIQGQGAGIAATQQVGNMKPDKIITGNLGPNSSRAISGLGIPVYQASGPVEDAVMALIDGKLAELTDIVPSHFGMNK
ncbi:MAG: diguanylate cyclase [Candidatus Nanohalarchaeota archaeon]|nr:MAG: diguanylate cyclase [Candidatus Nanohaloarchaeota archaeon]